MKKFFVVSLILSLILLTAIIKNSTKRIDEEIFSVSEGDIILIEDGQFHQVINNSNENLYFVCVFDGSRSH